MKSNGRLGDLFILFAGDSFCNKPDEPDNLPTIISAAFLCTFRNRGISASTSPQAARRFATLDAPYANCAATTVYWMLTGTNDLQLAVTGATLYDRKVGIAEDARAAGYDLVIASTLTPTPGYDAGEEAERVSHNSLIVADGDGAFDAVTDMTGDADFEDYTSDVFADQLHYSALGAQRYRDEFGVPALQALL